MDSFVIIEILVERLIANLRKCKHLFGNNTYSLREKYVNQKNVLILIQNKRL